MAQHLIPWSPHYYLIGDQGGKDGTWKTFQRFWCWVAAEIAKDAPGFFSTFAIIVAGLGWIVKREVAVQTSTSRMSRELAASELRTTRETADSRIEMLLRLLDMQFHRDYESWRGEFDFYSVVVRTDNPFEHPQSESDSEGNKGSKERDHRRS